MLEGDGLEHGGDHGIWPVKRGSSVHEIGTANFAFDGAAVPRKTRGRLGDAPGMWSTKKGTRNW